MTREELREEVLALPVVPGSASAYLSTFSSEASSVTGSLQSRFLHTYTVVLPDIVCLYRSSGMRSSSAADPGAPGSTRARTLFGMNRP